MSERAVLLVCDAGAEVGGGHLMRALTLAEALVGAGYAATVQAPAWARPLFDRFAAPGVGFRSDGDGAGFSAVVFDHYGLGADQHRALAAGALAVAVDDLADRPLGVDLLIDPGPDRTAADYAGRLPPGAELRLGPAFAPVRSAFAEARQAALARREQGPEVARILVSMGLTDLGGITARVADRLQPRLGEAVCDLVLGPDADSLAAMQRLAGRDPRFRVHVATDAMAQLMSGADLMIGAGGSSLWERCTLGLPGLVIVLADNQRPGAKALAARGAGLVLEAHDPGFEAAFDRAFHRLKSDAGVRRAQGRAAAALTDGRGARRIVEAITERLQA